jgi:hypothetical protein
VSDLIMRLEADLLEAAERLHRPRRRRLSRAPLTIGGVALLAATVAVVLSLTAASTNVTQQAFAVTQNADGSVTLTLSELTGIGGANRALAALGVRARIARRETGCAQSGVLIPPIRVRGGLLGMVEPQRFGEGLSGALWIIHPGAIPPGDTLLLTGELLNGGRPIVSSHGHFIRAFAGAIGLFRDPAPVCERPGKSELSGR